MAQTIMPNTMKNGKSLWLLIISIILMLSGVYVLFNPISALITSAILLGIVFIVIGTAYLMSFKELNSNMLLALGILDIMIGVLFLTNLTATATSMLIFMSLLTARVRQSVMYSFPTECGWMYGQAKPSSVPQQLRCHTPLKHHPYSLKWAALSPLQTI